MTEVRHGGARRRCAALVLALALPALAAAQDLDRDGLPDDFEQQLLDRFVPTFVVSGGECDAAPALFADGPVAAVADRSGVVYGHASPAAATRPGVRAIELQFFHLWSRDCGRTAHALDAEHVSALIEISEDEFRTSVFELPSPPAHQASALFWYSAAHEHTVCESSSAAPATALDATSSGPVVYISRGKHASYFAREQCAWGCGGDTCLDGGVTLEKTPVINLGEPEVPMPGRAWLKDPRWRLAAKMRADFDAPLRARLAKAESDEVVLLASGRTRMLKGAILGGDMGLDAIVTAGKATMGSLRTAWQKVKKR